MSVSGTGIGGEPEIYFLLSFHCSHQPFFCDFGSVGFTHLCCAKYPTVRQFCNRNAQINKKAKNNFAEETAGLDVGVGEKGREGCRNRQSNLLG